jgi:hypothetical protein
MSSEKSLTVHSNDKSKFVSGCNAKLNVKVEVELHLFMNQEQHEGKWLASCPGRFTP